MIDSALTFLTEELNDYIVRKTGTAGDYVSLRHLAKQGDGSETGPAPGTLSCALVNVEEERVARRQAPYTHIEGGQVSRRNPEILLNLYLLFAANPGTDNYREALKLLSHTIRFFQGRNDFTPESFPAMDPALKRLQLDLISIPLEEQSYLWGAVSNAYMPSVVYRLRLITLADEELLSIDTVIQGINTSTHPS
jgi:hypothetical protein